MEILVLLVVVGILVTPLIIGASQTQAPRILNLSRTFRQMVPTEIDGAHLVGVGVYRGYVQPMEAKERTVCDQITVQELPATVQIVSGWCRVAFCVAMLFLLPVGLGALAQLCSGQPGVILVLGVPGLLLAFGQASARKRLLTAAEDASAVARGVGIWTLLHNVAVVFVVFSGEALGTGDDVRFMSIRSAGVISLTYALVSFLLGAGLIGAARTMKRWRADRILEIAPPVTGYA